MMFTGAVGLASKSSCRMGCGDAQIALWKAMLPEYIATGHVSIINCTIVINKVTTKLP